MWSLRLVCLSALILGGNAYGQENNPRRVATENQLKNTKGADGEIAAMLEDGNVSEIQLAKLVAGKTQNREVQHFAQMMVKDHSAFLAQLGPYSMNPVAAQTEQDSNPARRSATDPTAPSSREADEEQRPASEISANRTSDRNSSASNEFDFVTFHREVGNKYTMLMSQQLAKHEGPQLDHAYIGQQIVAHTEMLACLKGLRSGASPELSTLIDEGMKKTEQHLAEAKRIIAQLPNDDTSKSPATDGSRS